MRTIIKEKPGLKITFYYEIYNSLKELINEATTTLVFVDAKSRKPCRPPELFTKVIKDYFD